MGNLITQVENPIKQPRRTSTTFSTFSRIPPPFFWGAKIFTISLPEGQSKTQSQRLRWKLPPKVLHPPSLPPNELFAFPTFFQKVASCCLGCFFYSKVGVSRVFHLHSFSDVGIFFFNGWCFMGGFKTSMFFSDVGSAFLQNGWVFKGFSKPRFFEKTLETFHPNVKHFQGFQINDCRSPWVCLFLPKLWQLQSLAQTAFDDTWWEWLQKVKVFNKGSYCTKKWIHTKLQELQSLGSPNFRTLSFGAQHLSFGTKKTAWHQMNLLHFSGGWTNPIWKTMLVVKLGSSFPPGRGEHIFKKMEIATT